MIQLILLVSKSALGLCRFNWGGSNIRPEATGYGVVYFIKNILDHAGDSLEVI